MPTFGRYRAIVVDVRDPERRGRIKVLCPAIYGEYKSNWCNPCLSVAHNNGGDFCLPPVGETVWIDFEAGDIDKPIYSGNWWSKDKTPINDYPTDAATTRIIEFLGCMFQMKQDELTIKVGNSTIVMKPDSIKFLTPRLDINEAETEDPTVHPYVITDGSTNVFINNKPAARTGDGVEPPTT